MRAFISLFALITIAGCASFENYNFNQENILKIGRSEKEIERDITRKPIEILKFAKIKNGQNMMIMSLEAVISPEFLAMPLGKRAK